MTASFARSRRHLLLLAGATLAGCASRGPTGPRQIPEQIGILPIERYGEVGLYYSSKTKQGVGLLTAGLGRVAMHASEKDNSKRFTELLAGQSLEASARLSDAVMTALAAEGARANPLDADKTAAPIKAWRFVALRPEADAVLSLSLNEVAYSTWNSTSVYPKISASMSLISTQDDSDLGAASYYVRIESDRSDRRDLPPLKRDRFENVDEVLADPARAAASLTDAIDRIAKLIAVDVAALQRGEELQWD